MKIRVQTEDFDTGAELAALGIPGAGALASFVGLVRTDDDVTGLELEHYPGMTEQALHEIVGEAIQRWQVQDVVLIHRVGRLPVGAQIVLVAVASPHRGAAFRACEFIMDHLKTDAPFWKKEYRGDAGSWVEARASDQVARARWSGAQQVDGQDTEDGEGD